MTPEPVRARIRRLYVPNALYFITAVTKKRQQVFANEPDLKLLRETMRKVKGIHSFKMQAYVFLPDHFHLLIFVPNTTDISKVLHSMQRNFTLNYKEAHDITHKISLWQRGFWDHVIRDERDFQPFSLHSLQSGQARICVETRGLSSYQFSRVCEARVVRDWLGTYRT